MYTYTTPAHMYTTPALHTHAPCTHHAHTMQTPPQRKLTNKKPREHGEQQRPTVETWNRLGGLRPTPTPPPWGQAPPPCSHACAGANTPQHVLPTHKHTVIHKQTHSYTHMITQHIVHTCRHNTTYSNHERGHSTQHQGRAGEPTRDEPGQHKLNT